ERMLGPNLHVVRLFRHDRRQAGRHYDLRGSEEPLSQLLARSRLWTHGGQPVRPREVRLPGHERQEGTCETRRGRASQAALWIAVAPGGRKETKSSRTLRKFPEKEIIAITSLSFRDLAVRKTTSPGAALDAPLLDAIHSYKL